MDIQETANALTIISDVAVADSEEENAIGLEMDTYTAECQEKNATAVPIHFLATTDEMEEKTTTSVIPETVTKTDESEDEVTTHNEFSDKSQSLVDIASNTFRELYKSLECEQQKLFELEERRKKLQMEMQVLKAEIEEEKNAFNLNLNQSVSDNLQVLNNDNPQEINEVKDDLLEEYGGIEDFENNLAAARDFKLSLDQHTNEIKSKLQTILDQCNEEREESFESENGIYPEDKNIEDEMQTN